MEPGERSHDLELAGLVTRWTGGEQVDQLRTWTSRTARLTLWSVGDARYVVKEMASADLAERLYENMQAFAEVAPLGVHRLHPLGWEAAPCCVGMPYVEAPSLQTLIKTQRFMWMAQPIEDVVALVGSSLAQFHCVMQTSDPVATRQADEMLANVLERLSILVGNPLESANLTAPVQVFGDVNPSHVLVESDVIALIDFPSEVRFAYPYRDLAWFLHQLHTMLVIELPRFPAARNLARFSQLRRRFLDAYSEASPARLTKQDECLVAMFECSYVAHSLGRRRRSWARYLPLRVALRIRARQLSRSYQFSTARLALQ